MISCSSSATRSSYDKKKKLSKINTTKVLLQHMKHAIKSDESLLLLNPSIGTYHHHHQQQQQQQYHHHSRDAHFSMNREIYQSVLDMCCKYKRVVRFIRR